MYILKMDAHIIGDISSPNQISPLQTVQAFNLDDMMLIQEDI